MKDRGAVTLVEELRRIIDRVEAERAGDPLVFKDLREAIGRHETGDGKTPPRRAAAPAAKRPVVAAPAVTRPPPAKPVPLINDRFADGEYETNPAWTVGEGAFWVEAGRGLRSCALIAKPTQAVRPRRVSTKKRRTIGDRDRQRRPT